MSRTVQLLVSQSVKLDGSGDGSTAGVGPTAQGESWNVSLISVKCSSNASEAIASVFLQNALLGTTTWGSTGDSDSAISQQVMGGQVITASWTGGDPGAVATVTVMGTREV
jgi:hypothetical protein